MITIDELEGYVKVSPEVEEFCSTYARNHTSLLKAWKTHPAMAEDMGLLKEQMAMIYCTYGPTAAFKRVLGRYSKLRAAAEKAQFQPPHSVDVDALLS